MHGTLRTSKLPKRLREKLRKARIELALIETEAAEKQAAARRQIAAIARDLLPDAAALARRGRPRLLAVCAKILADPLIAAKQIQIT